MPHVDARGLPMSGATSSALEAFETSLARLVGGGHDPLAPVARALAEAPHFAMGHAIRAAAAIIADDRSRAAALVDALRALEHWPDTTARERGHARAALAWLNGNAALAHTLYGAIVDDQPRDLVALRAAHLLDFRAGERASLHDRIARVMPHWDAGVPGFGHVLAMYAFGLEENGELDAAEDAARQALVLEPRCAGAIHVLAHVCEMRGRAADGIGVIESMREAWQDNPGLARHILWHLAVFHIDQGEVQRARAIYDEALAPVQGTAMATLVDASALLWRLELRGLPSPGRWRVLADAWCRQPLQGARAFNIVHAVIALAGAHRFIRARRAARWLEDGVAQERDDRREDLDFGKAFCAALVAFARGDYRTAVDRIAEVRVRADRCGGSVAQCDLIHLTLIEAALRGARDRLARSLVAERAARKPASVLSRWLCARAALPAAA